MLAWWGRKHTRSNPQAPPPLKRETPPECPHEIHSAAAPSIQPDKRKSADNPNSFDEAALLNSRNSPRSSREFGFISSSLRFSGSESDGSPLPLPLPSIPSTPSSGIEHFHAVGLGSGSASVSSVSSSGSHDDQGVCRGNGEIILDARSRSPTSGPRGVPATVPSLQTLASNATLDSPTGKQEDGKILCHRLPLPPASPTRPSALVSTRNSGNAENTGHTISKWKKGRLLGRGTFGQVYLGFNSENGQMCAIKEVRLVSEDQTSKECLKQLNQEITLLSQLSHPNIVQYYGSELGEESLSVYLEYVSGGSIHKLLQEYGPFKEPVIQNYSRQILSGLAYLHGRNTVHRDIKGANLLVDPNGEVKLSDFGMAKHISVCSSMLSFKGSPYWMAPEVVMNANGYSLPVDIWSLGCTILEMATAKPPWSQYEGVAAIFKIGNSKEIPEIPDHLSKDAKCFVKLCLKRDPALRPTATELLDHPFIRDPTVNFTRGALPFTFGRSIPPPLECHSNRNDTASGDRDYMEKPVGMVSKASKAPKESVRTTTSLPVSPCSSPSRRIDKSCFLYPVRSAYTAKAHTNHRLTNFSASRMRWNARYGLDPWHEVSLGTGSPQR